MSTTTKKKQEQQKKQEEEEEQQQEELQLQLHPPTLSPPKKISRSPRVL